MSTTNEQVTGIENIIEPTISLEPIVFNSKGSDKQARSDIGKKPFVWFDDVQLDVISFFKLSSKTFFPTLSLTFTDQYGYFSNLRFPNDDAKIRVFIDSIDVLLKPIYCEFKVINFNKIDHTTFKLEGILNINRMFTKRIESFQNSTSFNVLKEVAVLSNLGYSSNINATNDEMTWINPGRKVTEFCKDVVERSYRSESSFMWTFIDFYYNLNYIDIEEQLSFDINKQLGLSTGGLSELYKELGLADQAKPTLLHLSNDESALGTVDYFESFKVFNSSTRKSIKEGYLQRVKYYDWQEKNFSFFDIDSITTEGLVVLKGSEDEEFYRENIKQTWTGKLISNNAHDNYHYAKIQNRQNLNELEKIGIEIILPKPNFNIYRFMKLYLLIINQGMIEKDPKFNSKLSGEWIVSEIEFYYDNNSFQQKVRLVRRDLGFSLEEIDSN